MSSAKKTNPKKWKRIVAAIKAGSKGGKPGQWSARKAQLAVQRYKKSGGGYKGKTPQSKTSLNKWTKEKWRTSDNKPAIRKNKKGETVTKRYLPDKAWDKLSDSEKKATNRKKVLGSKKGKQFIPNTMKAKKVRKNSSLV